MATSSSLRSNAGGAFHTDEQASAKWSVLCTVLGIFDYKNAVTLKTRLGVRQGHWKCTMRYSVYGMTSY